MWHPLKRWLAGDKGDAVRHIEALQWIEPGPDNPFDVRLLDCRPVTWNMVSTTSDRRVAERYNELRHSDGRDLLAQPIPDSVRIATAVALPHNGATLEGVVFKADVMEVKWDIYIYDSQFLFARSWTGELKYRALANVGEDEIRITEIECARREAPLATATVYFLLATHAMQRVLPHQIPLDLQSQDAQTIALWSFSMFGRLGCYATVNDVTRIGLT